MIRSLPAAVLFDMDGLLIDSERLAQEATRATSQLLELHIPEPVALRMIGLGRDALERMIAAELGPHFPFERFQLEWESQYHQRIDRGVPVKPGVAEALAALGAAGLPCAVATSTSTHLARHKLEKAGLLTHFPVVVGRDAVVHGKPAPDLYLRAARELGADAATCWAFEDSLPGLTAAVASGARTHWVPDIAQIHVDDLPHGVETIESLHQVGHWLAAHAA
jgi:HAD superfamily hydrolase (TIGR01509 family)